MGFSVDSVGFLWGSVGHLPFWCSVWECGGTLGLLFPGGMGGGSGGSGPKALSPQTSVRQRLRIWVKYFWTAFFSSECP